MAAGNAHAGEYIAGQRYSQQPSITCLGLTALLRVQHSA